MARQSGSKTRHENGVIVTTKSHYGSHKEMVVDHNEYGVELKEDQVLLKSDTHFYVTKKNRLDDGLADPARYSSEKLLLTKKPQE